MLHPIEFNGTWAPFLNRDAFQNRAQKQGPDQALKDFTNGDKMETAASSRGPGGENHN